MTETSEQIRRVRRQVMWLVGLMLGGFVLAQSLQLRAAEINHRLTIRIAATLDSTRAELTAARAARVAALVTIQSLRRDLDALLEEGRERSRANRATLVE